MPLLHRKPFVPSKPPSDLRPDEEIFVCPFTNEVFRDYECFFRRTVLCNSLVWSCEYTGRSGFTYQEALESEAKARRQMNAFPQPLHYPALLLAHQIKRSSLSALVGDMVGFFRQRYVEGESVDVAVNQGKFYRPAVIQQVACIEGTCSSPPPLIPSSEALSLSAAANNREHGRATKKKSLKQSEGSSVGVQGPPPCDFRYKVQFVDHYQPARAVVEESVLVRKRGALQRETVDIFYRRKLSRSGNGSPYLVKPHLVSSYNLDSPPSHNFHMIITSARNVGGAPMRFGYVSPAPEPAFSPPPLHNSPLTNYKWRHVYIASSELAEVSGKSTSPRQGAPLGGSMQSGSPIKRHRSDGNISQQLPDEPAAKRRQSEPLRVKEAAAASNHTNSKRPPMLTKVQAGRKEFVYHYQQFDNSPASVASSNVPSSGNDRSAFQKYKKPLQIAPHSSTALTPIQRGSAPQQRQPVHAVVITSTVAPPVKTERDRVIEEKRNQRIVEQLRLKEERRKEREKKQADRMAWIQWNRPRDDLLCDDLKPLPEPKVIGGDLAGKLVGDCLMICEFVNVFGPLFEIDSFFDNPVGFADVQEALLSKELDGPLFSLLQFLLHVTFEAQEFLENEEGVEVCSAPVHLPLPSTCNRATDGLADGLASGVAMSTLHHHGTKLRDVEVTATTVSEVLRLHILAVGGHSPGSGYAHRSYGCNWQRVGGYTAQDDACVELRSLSPRVLLQLQQVSVFELDAADRCLLLRTLCDHLLMTLQVRDRIDEAFLAWRRAKLSWRECQVTFERHRREEQQLRAKCQQEKEAGAAGLQTKVEASTVSQHAPAVDQESGLSQPCPPAVKSEEGTMAFSSSIAKAESTATTLSNDTPSPAPGCTSNSEIKVDPTQSTSLPTGLGISGTKKSDENEPVINKSTACAGNDVSNSEEELQQLIKKHKAEQKTTRARLQEEIASEAANIRHVSLGRDRYYRKFWVFRSLPGLFVETDIETLGQMVTLRPAPSPTGPPTGRGMMLSVSPSVPRSLASCITSLPGDSAKGNGEAVSQLTRASNESPITATTVHQSSKNASMPSTQSVSSLAISSAQDIASTLPVMQNAQPSTASAAENTPPSSVHSTPTPETNRQPVAVGPWSVYGSKDAIDGLLASLNPRGHRERALREVMLQRKDFILRNIENYTDELYDSGNKVVKGKKPNSEPALLPHKILEQQLREQLTSLEDRLWQGCMGNVQVCDRNIWRDMLKCCSHPPSNSVTPEGNSLPTSAYGRVEEVSGVVKELIEAVLTIEGGIEGRFLKAPLMEMKKDGEKTDKSRKKTSTLERWRESVRKCTSLSQVAVHLAALDASVMWERSVLNARCRSCRRKTDGEKMLLCDDCDRGYHIYCLQPPLTAIPRGDWFCTQCTLRKKKLASKAGDQKMEKEAPVAVETAAMNGQVDVSKKSNDKEATQTDIDRDVCFVCEDGGQLLMCDTCPRCFHLKCTQPLLQRVPRGDWSCHVCQSQSSNNKTPGQQINKRNRKGSRQSRFSLGKKGVPQSQDNNACGSPAATTNTYRRSSESRSGQLAQQLKACETLWRELKNHNEAGLFLEPVPAEKVPDYYKIIKEPMDLGTVRQKLKLAKYDSANGFLADVRQIFINCAEYNAPRSREARAGVKLSLFFETKLSEYGLDLPS